jgi:hypothetical protein
MKKCECGCNKYYDACREGVKNDYIAQSAYCANSYLGAFGGDGYKNQCAICTLVKNGMDCKNNKIK